MPIDMTEIIQKALERSKSRNKKQNWRHGYAMRKQPALPKSGTKFEGQKHSHRREIDRRRRQIAKGMLKPTDGRDERG